MNPVLATIPKAPEPVANATADASPGRWHPATLLAFRFFFVYFGIYILTTQMLAGLLPFPGIRVPILQSLPPFRNVVLWVGHHVFGITRVIPYQSSGSGDKTFDWLHAFTLVVIALIAAAIWSALAREAKEHERLHARCRLFLRFALGTTLVSYGAAKVIPVQMPVLFLQKLLEPYGNFSMASVLWTSIGASPAYESFTGCAELGAALLLFLPRTATLGALLALMDTIAVLALNLMYDVPVKLFAFHLVVLSLVLIARNIPRMIDLFLRYRTTHILAEPPLGGTARTRRGLGIAQVVFGVYVAAFGLYGTSQQWKVYGGGQPRSALYGIWDVDQMIIDGQPHPAILTDTSRWRRAVFQSPTGMNYQRMNDTFGNYRTAIDTTARTITFTTFDSASTKSTLSYQRPTKSRLLIDGPLSGHEVHLELSFRDPDSFQQRSRRFTWIQEAPYFK